MSRFLYNTSRFTLGSGPSLGCILHQKHTSRACVIFKLIVQHNIFRWTIKGIYKFCNIAKKNQEVYVAKTEKRKRLKLEGNNVCIQEKKKKRKESRSSIFAGNNTLVGHPNFIISYIYMSLL